MQSTVQRLADALVLGSLLDEARDRFGGYELLAHWQQGEFHHDILVELATAADLPGRFLLVATNCNGGVKEVMVLGERPDRGGLWKHRCPGNGDLDGPAPHILARATTVHWFDPCELLVPEARSELRPEFRERQPGGGWVQRGCGKP